MRGVWDVMKSNSALKMLEGDKILFSCFLVVLVFGIIHFVSKQFIGERASNASLEEVL
ncbi:hypothetical protein CASFOL_042153 [Castilleja foliolosa]|uniref:Uncharacterized protein n=1 Tax=Castilleja foliolosa TaxID=1961234 RepID=A0ABD3B9Y7_9LAMI